MFRETPSSRKPCGKGGNCPERRGAAPAWAAVAKERSRMQSGFHRTRAAGPWRRRGGLFAPLFTRLSGGEHGTDDSNLGPGGAAAFGRKSDPRADRRNPVPRLCRRESGQGAAHHQQGANQQVRMRRAGIQECQSIQRHQLLLGRHQPGRRRHLLLRASHRGARLSGGHVPRIPAAVPAGAGAPARQAETDERAGIEVYLLPHEAPQHRRRQLPAGAELLCRLQRRAAARCGNEFRGDFRRPRGRRLHAGGAAGPAGQTVVASRNGRENLRSRRDQRRHARRGLYRLEKRPRQGSAAIQRPGRIL
ncbi:MAG: hypothetical protein BWZ10_01048 [candidate division BRC1 bacterium ADurb.BinA364]|nr:MAG: hypothetical protein BWZ10_01048 [candidate division BRC1 bacterium ADurb.BinA364]